MARQESILQASGGGLVLQVRFVWHVDRYAHTVTVHSGEHVTPLLASREGAGHDPWPPSPPLQSASQEQAGGSQAALLVGMAGQAHWSLAVTAEPDSAALCFDVACRTRERPVMLGSQYRTMIAPGEIANRHLGRFHLNAAQVQLQLVEVDGDDVARLATTESGLAITIDPGPVDSARTIRWKYRISAG